MHCTVLYCTCTYCYCICYLVYCMAIKLIILLIPIFKEYLIIFQAERHLHCGYGKMNILITMTMKQFLKCFNINRKPTKELIQFDPSHPSNPAPFNKIDFGVEAIIQVLLYFSSTPVSEDSLMSFIFSCWVLDMNARIFPIGMFFTLPDLLSQSF